MASPNKMAATRSEERHVQTVRAVAVGGQGDYVCGRVLVA